MAAKLTEMQEKRIASFRELRHMIKEDLSRNGGVTRPGFQALVIYRYGVWLEGFRARKIVRRPLYWLYVLGSAFVRNFYGIELQYHTRIGRRLLIGHQHGIVIHPKAVIGDDCVIRQGVTLGQVGEGPGTPLAPKLGNRVDVAAGAILFGGITVGDDVTIGPNAVVMTNVPAGSIVTAPLSRIMPRMPVRKAKPDVVRPSAEPPAPDKPEARITQQTGT